MILVYNCAWLTFYDLLCIIFSFSVGNWGFYEWQQCVIVWEIRVVGWEIIYGAEFIPDAKDEYTLIIQKATKMSPTDDPVVCSSFKIKELGKIAITIDNPTSKKKRLLYRFKVKPYTC